MKYITLTRGNEDVWYPMYELKSEYFDNFTVAPLTTSVSGVIGLGLATVVPTQLPVILQTAFADTLPEKADDFGSILQTQHRYAPREGDGVLDLVDAVWEEIPIGTKPDDWDTNWFDYFQRGYDSYYQIGTVSGVYPATQISVPPTWDSTAQYYKNVIDVRERFWHVFKTGAGYTFGIYTDAGIGFAGYNKHYSRLGTLPGVNSYNPAASFLWRTPQDDGMSFYFDSNQQWRVENMVALNIMNGTPPGESVSYDAIPLTDNRKEFFAFIYTTYNNVDYYGVMEFGLSSGGAPVYVRAILFNDALWGADSISDEEPEPSEYEFEEGPVTPSRTGGQGTFTSISNNDGDRSGTSLLSAISTANTTFKTVLGDAFNIYEVGASDLSKVINVLYGSSYFTRFENMMFNPLSAIISCALLPEIFVTSPVTLHDMLAGGYNISNHIWPNPVQFKSPEPLIVKHIGDISLNKYFDGYADFDPYTKVKLHLPYIGEIAIDTNKIAHGELAVDYVCDVLSGNVAAWVWCNDIDGNHQYCYTATGNCAYNIPLFSATADGSAIGKIIGGVASISVGNILGGAMSVADGAAGVVSRHTQVTGTYSGNIGQVTNPKCFLEISRPQWVNVDDENDKPYKHGEGLPAVMKGTIASNNLKNHVSVSWVDLTNIVAATPEELAEIESLLKSGILIKE